MKKIASFILTFVIAFTCTTSIFAAENINETQTENVILERMSPSELESIIFRETRTRSGKLEVFTFPKEDLGDLSVETTLYVNRQALEDNSLTRSDLEGKTYDEVSSALSSPTVGAVSVHTWTSANGTVVGKVLMRGCFTYDGTFASPVIEDCMLAYTQYQSNFYVSENSWSTTKGTTGRVSCSYSAQCGGTWKNKTAKVECTKNGVLTYYDETYLA